MALADQTDTPPRRATTDWLALGAAGVTVLLWASAFVAIRYVGRDFSPGALSLGRLVVGSLVLGVAAAAGPWRRPRRWEWLLLVVCGLVWFGFYNVVLNAAEQRIDAGTTAMLVNVGPLLIALIAGTVLSEGYPRGLVVGSVVAFAGVVLIGTASSSGLDADVWGVVLCLLAAVAYAVGVVTQKPLLRRLPALQVTWLACAIGAVSCLPFASDLVDDLGDAPASAIWWLVYLGVFPTALAFSTWAYALSRTSAGRMGATTYLVPPLAVLLAWGLLGETPAGLALVGGALCLVGVALSRRQASRGPKQSPS